MARLLFVTSTHAGCNERYEPAIKAYEIRNTAKATSAAKTAQPEKIGRIGHEQVWNAVHISERLGVRQTLEAMAGNHVFPSSSLYTKAMDYTYARLFLLLASISGFLAVGLGAFGAHGLRARLTPEMMAIFQTGVQYHFYHTIALLAVGLFAMHSPQIGLLRVAGWLFVAGILVFSGSLYVLALSGIRWLGAITPIGGTAFLIGWVTLAMAALRLR